MEKGLEMKVSMTGEEREVRHRREEKDCQVTMMDTYLRIRPKS